MFKPSTDLIESLNHEAETFIVKACLDKPKMYDWARGRFTGDELTYVLSWIRDI